MKNVIELMEKGLIPDFMTRIGIRHLLAKRLRDEAESAPPDLNPLLEELRNSPIALHTDKANEQHYELPPAFFRYIMGEHLKYSACYWPPGVATLSEAEAAMLALTCERAGLMDGQTILELGCGWGSLTLWMAEHYPHSRITALSNSRPQREYIEGECRRLRINNVRVITTDMNDFYTDQRFDRVVSVEMFEHMRNYQALMQRIQCWLKPAGKLFVHIFTHRRLAYPFETEGEENWMGRYFFTGGLMPSADLLLHFQDDLALEKRWYINGVHYQRTCETWLTNQDRHREAILALFKDVYGLHQAARWFQRWRVFFMACAELFGYRDGTEWGVSHYLFHKPVQ
ncbi:MAG: cyclopropane-fatty-acyl-phospholipid synthase family protein [Candidatus Competibacteraceae bacterium]